jgi:hypothetical protein
VFESAFGLTLNKTYTLLKIVLVNQSIARCIFQLSRRDREYLPFSLMLRDKIENFCLSVSCFETRSRISVFQSHASRRDREFLSFSLMLRDEIENFCLSVSCFETRSRVSVFWSRASRRDREFLSFSLMLRDEVDNFYLSVSCFETRARFSVFILVIQDKNENNV